MIESFHGKDVRYSIQKCITMSDLDKVMRRVYGYSSEQHMLMEYSGLKKVCRSRVEASCNCDVAEVHTPMLLLQPEDDPLHQVEYTEVMRLYSYEC